MIALVIAVQVARVVVFPDRALVTRAVDAACAATPVKVEFQALPPSTAPASLRASTSEGSVEALQSTDAPRATAFSAEAAKLEERLRELEQERLALQDAKANAGRLDHLAENLEALAAERIGQEASQPDVEAWGLALQRTLKTRLAAAQQRVEVRARSRKLRRELAAAQRQLAALGVARQTKERRAEVVISCAAGRTARVELSYLVGGASWEPAYEAHAEDENVSLALYARVRQRTGESWEGAQLSLSTAVPSENATPPELLPFRVFAEKRPPPAKVLVRRDEHQGHAERGSLDASAGGYGMQAEEQGLSVRLTARGSAGVRGDGTVASLFVAQTQLAAAYAFRTVPRQVPNVFRVADLVNTAPFPLLPGNVEIFRQGGYLGKIRLERVAQGAAFHLSFGLAEEVKVKRVVLEEIARDKGIFKTSQRFRYAYRFEVENGTAAQTIELAEQVPVSELSDVHVELEDATTPGFERKLEDGIITWKLQLEAGEKRTLQLAFHVDVPADYATGL